MNLLSKIGAVAIALIALAVVGKLVWGLVLLSAYGLYLSRRPIAFLLKSKGII